MAARASRTLVKICSTCGRQITWRKKWEKNWDSITYCSDSCRSNKKPRALDLAFESAIMRILREKRRLLDVGDVKGATGKGTVTCEEAEDMVLRELALEGREEMVGLGSDEQPRDGSMDTHGGNEFENGNDGSHPGGSEPSEQPSPSSKPPPSRTRERCRQAARRLASRGQIVVTQGGKVVDPSFAKGVMELKLV